MGECGTMTIFRVMKIKLLTLIPVMLIQVTVLFGQTDSQEKEIENVILTLFKGMQLGDSSLASGTFADEVTTVTIYKTKEGVTKLHRENSIKRFMEAIAKPHDKTWYEEIWNLKIQIDGEFAQAWCDYAFYLDNEFSHCGVDAFHLYKSDQGWKIFHLADTRHKADCVIPKEIQDKHK